MGRYLLKGIMSSYKDASASVCMNREMNESFGVDVREDVMSPGQFNVYHVQSYDGNESQSKGNRPKVESKENRTAQLFFPLLFTGAYAHIMYT